MTGILIPEMVIYQTLENITQYIRDDLTNNASSLEQSFLYRLLGLDDDGEVMKVNRYNYFLQAKKIFETKQNLSVNIGYNPEVAKIIAFHIILPSEQPSSIPLGEDEGYQTETDDDGNVQLKFCQMFAANYQIMITSDNSNEVTLVYHIYKSLLIALVPHLSLKGLMNPKFSGNDIVFQDEQMPMGIFHKVLNLSFDYELIVPQLLFAGVMKSVTFEGTPNSAIISSGGAISFDEGEEDSTGKTKDDYPYKSVEPSSPVYSSTKIDDVDNYPNKRVEPSGDVVSDSDNDGVLMPSKRVDAGSKASDSSDEDLPSRIVEPGSTSSVDDSEYRTSKRVEPSSSVSQGISEESYPSKKVDAGKQASTSTDNTESYPSKKVEPSAPAVSDGRNYPPRKIINGLVAEDNTLRNVVVAVTNSDGTELLSGIAVQIKSENYLYYGITDENGVVTFKSIANEIYTMTLAKSGVNQGEYYNIDFSNYDTYVKYSQVEKTIWDGMNADTVPILYVDIHDGGKA